MRNPRLIETQLCSTGKATVRRCKATCRFSFSLRPLARSASLRYPFSLFYSPTLGIFNP